MARWTQVRKKKAAVKTLFSGYYVIFLLFIYGPMFAMFILSFQGRRGGTSFPMRGVSLYWWNKLLEPSTVGDLQGAMGRSIVLALIVMVITAPLLDDVRNGVSQAVYRLQCALLHHHDRPHGPGHPPEPRHGHPAQADRHSARVVVDRARGARGVDLAVRFPRHDGGIQPLRQRSRGGRPATWARANGPSSRR